MPESERKENARRANAPIRLEISFRNPNTKTSYENGFMIDSKGKKKGPDPRLAIHLIEVMDDGLIIDTPTGSCQRGQIIQLKMKSHGLAKDIQLEVSAKVVKESFDSQASARDSVSLTFTEFNAEIWKELREHFHGRQRDVEKLFEAMKT